MRVLVVDDDPNVRRLVRVALRAQGLVVIDAADAEAALRLAAETCIDVAVLDQHLPGRSGLELLPLLRQHDPDVQIVMLTAAASATDLVLCLVRGADDYVVKPFSMLELAARVLAAGRRRMPRQRRAGIDAGGLHIDTTARTVRIGNEPVDLTRLEFDLLVHLASHPGRIFTRAELLRAVWESSAEWQSEATVTEHVRRLRAKTKLDPAIPLPIVTVRGAGYRFDAAPETG